ncbi:MAG TPA: Gfo/Idh/MocA family oxidoreductase [Gemmatimonadaceae bacterium]|nr:Gfo/Idh/MocA family oxidoreductase [Gemmatimonadaceae bacterium]
MTDDTSDVGRRAFLKSASAAGLGAMVSSRLPASMLAGKGSANEKIVVAVIGLNGRGAVHAQNFARLKNSEVAYLCDVDATVLGKALKQASTGPETAPKAIGDFRRALDDKSVDVISIAAPDHWHAPMAILAMKAGKHVYLEKPCGHNPREGELLVAAQKKYNRVVQMGTQQRSSDRTIEALHMIKDGVIGRPYLVRAWYANTRLGIGKGKPAPVPSNLNYDLWQGPAPQTPYRDNVIHYNWHWFKRWGTGEICNNGTHEIDIARLALGVDYPTRVMSNGGRYHFADDWEFPDTQEATFEFEGGRTIIWQGQSCNGLKTFGRGRGTAILGTTGSIVLDRDGYVQYDLANKVVKENIEPKSGNGLELTGDDAATSVHMENFLSAIRGTGTLRAPIADAAKSVLLCHLGNIAQYTGNALHTDPKTGHIIGDAAASKYWSREYAPQWAPTV